MPSVILQAYYETRNDDRPRTEEDFRRSGFWIGLQFIRAELQRHRTEHGEEVMRAAYKGLTGNKEMDEAAAMNRVDWLCSKTRPDQISRVAATQAVEMMDQLTPGFKRMAFKMADGATLPECAKELGMTLTEAMKSQMSLRTIVRWIAEEDADEKIRASGAVEKSSHARDRARERYNLLLEEDDFREMVRQIRGDEAIFCKGQDLRREHWIVEIRGTLLLVVYEPPTHTIITVLPEHARDKYLSERKSPRLREGSDSDDQCESRSNRISGHSVFQVESSFVATRNASPELSINYVL